MQKDCKTQLFQNSYKAQNKKILQSPKLANRWQDPIQVYIMIRVPEIVFGLKFAFVGIIYLKQKAIIDFHALLMGMCRGFFFFILGLVTFLAFGVVIFFPIFWALSSFLTLGVVIYILILGLIIFYPFGLYHLLKIFGPYNFGLYNFGPYHLLSIF